MGVTFGAISIILSPKFTSPLPERITPRKYKTNILAFIEEDYDTMEDVGAAYKQAYLEALYGQQVGFVLFTAAKQTMRIF